MPAIVALTLLVGRHAQPHCTSTTNIILQSVRQHISLDLVLFSNGCMFNFLILYFRIFYNYQVHVNNISRYQCILAQSYINNFLFKLMILNKEIYVDLYTCNLQPITSSHPYSQLTNMICILNTLNTCLGVGICKF